MYDPSIMTEGTEDTVITIDGDNLVAVKQVATLAFLLADSNEMLAVVYCQCAMQLLHQFSARIQTKEGVKPNG